MRSLPSISVRRAVGIAVALVATSLTAQAQGRVTVRVTDAANQQPVGQAQVQIVGTTLGGLTGPEGRFIIRGVPPGTHQVRVLRVGYGEQKKPVTVTAEQDVTVDFTISAVADQPNASRHDGYRRAASSGVGKLGRTAGCGKDRVGIADPQHRRHAQLAYGGRRGADRDADRYGLTRPHPRPGFAQPDE